MEPEGKIMKNYIMLSSLLILVFVSKVACIPVIRK